MVVAVVDQHSWKPREQLRRQDQIVPNAVSSHVAYFGLKATRQTRHSYGLLVAGRELQPNRVADVFGGGLLSADGDVQTAGIVEPRYVMRHLRMAQRWRFGRNKRGE
jgi:hypothetical protein